MDKQGRFERILGYIGAGIGIIIGVGADAPLWGACLAAALLFAGFYLGKKIDQVCKREKPAKSIVKPILIAILTIAVCLALFTMCSHKNSPNLTRCSNCGTMMPPESIKPYGCTRCDGRDWS